MAMAGKGCVAIAVDKRFGSGPQLVNISCRRILTIHSKLLVGFTGLDSDVQNIAQELSIHVSSKSARESSLFRNSKNSNTKKSRISPRAMAALTSNVLYSKRRRSSPYYCEPIIAGLELEIDNNGLVSYKPFLCSQDVIGAQLKTRDFVCCGAAKNALYGTAEAMWRPNLDPEELAQVCARAFMSALERDCLSGYGAVVYVITEDGIVRQELLSRTD